jgi:putative hydrolase of the HAD superfamily
MTLAIHSPNHKGTKIIFFDAVGTLFTVKGGVGSLYSEAALKYGITEDPDRLNQAFYRVFQQTPSPAFPGADRSDLPQLEYQWWQEVMQQTFKVLQYPYPDPFPKFKNYFQEVFDLFATSAAWSLYEETIPVLDILQSLGIPVGLISNFDSRLYAVLNALNLERYFSSVTISTHVGSAKPAKEVFKAALDTYCLPETAALHVGDSSLQDYQGAKQAGLKALWLDREGVCQKEIPDEDRISDLYGILEWLKG